VPDERLAFFRRCALQHRGENGFFVHESSSELASCSIQQCEKKNRFLSRFFFGGGKKSGLFSYSS
jgi:hypothetical protein